MPDVEFAPILSQVEEDHFHLGKDKKGVLSDYMGHLRLTLGEMVLRPYLTKEGYLGLAPLHTQPGDIVVIFSWCEVPYVIRPVIADTD